MKKLLLSFAVLSTLAIATTTAPSTSIDVTTTANIGNASSIVLGNSVKGAISLKHGELKEKTTGSTVTANFEIGEMRGTTLRPLKVGTMLGLSLDKDTATSLSSTDVTEVLEHTFKVNYGSTNIINYNKTSGTKLGTHTITAGDTVPEFTVSSTIEQNDIDNSPAGDYSHSTTLTVKITTAGIQ